MRFPEADEAWIPTLGDILNKQSDPDAYPTYSKVGWDALEVPEECAYVNDRMDVLKVRFDERYFNRMLNAETLERWQVRLQNRFDEVVCRYDRAYSLYNRYQEDMDSDVLPGETYERTEEETHSGKDTRTVSVKQGGSDSSEGRNVDTPDSVVNADDNYADSLSKNKVTYGRTDDSTDETSYGHKVSHTVKDTRTVTGKDLMLNVNSSIDDWRDIDTEFVREFENNFLNIFWY